MIFVVEFNRATNTLMTFEKYTDSDRSVAESRYRWLLKQAWFDPEDDTIEVNIFESASEVIFRQTHARYFQNTDSLIESLRNVIS
jgi:hypothetical protein